MPRGLSGMSRNLRITVMALSVLLLAGCCTLSWSAASAIFPPPGGPIAAASTAGSGSPTASATASATDQSTATDNGTPTSGGDGTPSVTPGGDGSPTPSASPAGTPTLTPTAQPPTPTATPCPDPYNNPWGYNFCPGAWIYNPKPGFCTVFPCVSKFGSQSGYVVECNNGLYAHNGGMFDVCGKSGYLRTLYQHQVPSP